MVPTPRAVILLKTQGLPLSRVSDVPSIVRAMDIQPAPAATSSTAIERIAERLLEYAVPHADEALVPAVAIGFVTRNGLVATRFIGSNQAGEPVDADTAFEIGSATKSMLGVTEAAMVDRGRMEWNDRVIEHFPTFTMPDPWVTREFRIVDLLAQRSGLPEYAAELPNEFGLPWRTGVDALQHVTTVSSFRSEFAYQNMPHFVAGEIVAEKLEVESWAAAVQQIIFDPLRMQTSATDSNALARFKNSTRGHTVRDGKLRERPLEEFPAIAEGAGAVVSNVADMARWLAFHLNDGVGPEGPLLSPDQLHETYRPRIAVSGHFAAAMQHGTSRPEIGYATGWFVHALPEGRVIEHGGNTEGYNSAVAFDPDRGLGVVVLSNQGHHGGIASHLGKYAMDLIQGRDPVDYVRRATRQREEQEATAREVLQKVAGTAHPINWYTGEFEHPVLGRVSFDTDTDTDTDTDIDRDRLSAKLGTPAVDAVATRLAGSTFEIRWYQSGDPELTEHKSTLVFEGDGSSKGGERATRFTLKNFIFTRTR